MRSSVKSEKFQKVCLSYIKLKVVQSTLGKHHFYRKDLSIVLQTIEILVFLLFFFFIQHFFDMASLRFYWSYQDQIWTIGRPHHEVLPDEAVQDFIIPFRSYLPFIVFFSTWPPLVVFEDIMTLFGQKLDLIMMCYHMRLLRISSFPMRVMSP